MQLNTGGSATSSRLSLAGRVARGSPDVYAFCAVFILFELVAKNNSNQSGLSSTELAAEEDSQSTEFNIACWNDVIQFSCA